MYGSVLSDFYTFIYIHDLFIFYHKIKIKTDFLTRNYDFF